MRPVVLFLVIFLLAMVALGCSGQQSPISPGNSGVEGQTGSNSHYVWGIYTFVCDPERETIDIIEMREALMHINALPFLETPTASYISLESLEFMGGKVEAGIGLTHPFLSLNEFTGFDVCGVLYTHGSVSGFNDPELVMAGEGDTRLLNPDSYGRWWNPAEFPHGKTMQTYVEGRLGTPSFMADYNTTVNGYKYFADGLGADDPLSIIDLEKRGMFSAGQKRVRHYSIDLSGGLIFNYAIDASWQFPQGSKPYDVPDDFPPNANRPEAWRISVTETENTLIYEESTGNAGGDLGLLVDVYDWFDSDLNTVGVESLSGLPYTSSATPVGGGSGYSTYQLSLTGDNLTENGVINLLFTIQSEAVGYGGLLPGKPVCAYFTHSIEVSGGEPVEPTLHILIPNGGEVWGVGTNHNIFWESTGNITNVKLEYSKDDFGADIHEIIGSTPNDGMYDWLIPDDP